MQIRSAVPADIPALLPLLELLFDQEHDIDFDEAKARRGLEMMIEPDEKRLVLVGEIEGRISGMCTGQLLISTAMGAPSLWVEDVVLHPDFRGRGLMPLLLAELENWAVSKGASRVQLQCDTENPGGLAFYPKVGFERTHMIGFTKVF